MPKIDPRYEYTDDKDDDGHPSEWEILAYGDGDQHMEPRHIIAWLKWVLTSRGDAQWQEKGFWHGLEQYPPVSEMREYVGGYIIGSEIRELLQWNAEITREANEPAPGPDRRDDGSTDAGRESLPAGSRLQGASIRPARGDAGHPPLGTSSAAHPVYPDDDYRVGESATDRLKRLFRANPPRLGDSS